MNHLRSPHDDQHRLEQATPLGPCAGDPPVDAQTAALREAWLALGELLRAAEPMQPAPRFQPETPTRPRALGQRWPRWVLAAAATGLLVWTALGPDRAGQREPAVVDSATPGPPTRSDQATAVLRVATDRPAPARPDVESREIFAWNDTVDAQLVRARYRAWMLRESPAAIDMWQHATWYSMNELAAELQQDGAL